MGFFDTSSKSFVTAPDWVRGQMEGAVNNYAGLSPEAWGGPINAELNDYLASAWSNLFNSENQNQAMQGMFDVGSMGLEGMQDLGNYLDTLQNNGAPQFQYDQGTYDQSFGNLTAGLQDVFDLGGRRIQQGFDWNVLPGLNMASALSGGSGNTNAFRQSALGQAMTDQNIQDFGSGLWMNAANRADANAMTGGGANLNAEMANIANILSGRGNLASMALPGLTGAYNAAQGIGQNQLLAGQGQQAFDQGNLDRERSQFYYDDNRALDWARNQALDLSNIGNTFATRKNTANPSGFSQLGQTIGAFSDIGNLFGFPGMGATPAMPSFMPTVGPMSTPYDPFVSGGSAYMPGGQFNPFGG